MFGRMKKLEKKVERLQAQVDRAANQISEYKIGDVIRYDDFFNGHQIKIDIIKEVTFFL